tara:strand:- start:325 stop:474 length:150 start_codon:yes stop_codon:yes gene_type:complete
LHFLALKQKNTGKNTDKNTDTQQSRLKKKSSGLKLFLNDQYLLGSDEDF